MLYHMKDIPNNFSFTLANQIDYVALSSIIKIKNAPLDNARIPIPWMTENNAIPPENGAKKPIPKYLKIVP